jgi:hypothetical protein
MNHISDGAIFLAGFFTCIVTLIILALAFIPLARYFSNLSVVRPGNDKFEATPIENQLEALHHLPKNPDKKQLQIWTIERASIHLDKALKEIQSLVREHNLEPLILCDKIDEANTCCNSLALLYAQTKGPITQEQIDRWDDSYNWTKQQPTEEELKECGPEYMGNPVMERQNKN